MLQRIWLSPNKEWDWTFLIVFFLSFNFNRETTDSYTIATAPNFGSILRGPSFIYSSFSNRSKSSLDIDGKTPFLSSPEATTQSIWRKKGSMQNLVGEMPIGYGCSLTQTIFNGMLFHLILFCDILVTLYLTCSLIILDFSFLFFYMDYNKVML